MLQALADRIAYERTYSLSERWERRREKLAQFVAWHCLPQRVRMWVIVRAHADRTTGEFGSVHPDSVSAFDLYSSCRAKPISDRMSVGE